MRLTRSFFFAAGTALVLAGLGRSVDAAIITNGIQVGVDRSNWLSAGDANLNGTPTGLNWEVSFLAGPFRLDSYGNQSTFAGNTEWPAPGQTTASGEAGGFNFGLTSLNGATAIVISAIAPAAGDYSLYDGNYPSNPITITATATGQVLQWTDTTPNTTVSYALAHTVSGVNDNGFVGAVAISSVPEPTSLAVMALSGLALTARRRRA